MEYKDKLQQHGYFKFTARDAKTKKILWESETIENQLTQININYRQAMLDGTFTSQGFAVDDLEIMYFAFGNGTTPVTVGDIQLENEVVRRPITTLSRNGNDVVSVVALTPSQGNFTIREIGVFCGSSATIAPNTGNMISRINVNIIKTNNVELVVTRTDRVVV